MKKNLTALAIIVSTLTLDVITKMLIVKHFCSPDVFVFNSGCFHELNYLNGFVRLSLVYNQGGVWGIFQGYKTVFLVISIVVLSIMIGYYFYEFYKKNNSWLFTLAMSFIVSGALGNIIDRLMKDRRGVVDFVSIGVDGFYRWPSFNVADSCIITGAFFLVIVFYRDEKMRRNETLSK
jgi:signal peptidase II